LKGILPEAIRVRTRKLGFPNMAESWSSTKAQEFIRDVVTSANFRESSIWNGKRINLELEQAIQKQDFVPLKKAWTYVQAMTLMNLFREKRKTFLKM